MEAVGHWTLAFEGYTWSTATTMLSSYQKDVAMSERMKGLEEPFSP